ncbi:MAG TPA: histidine kinase [Acidimicrobiales bacterium]
MFDFRLAAIALTVGSVAFSKNRPTPVILALVAALSTSYVPLRRWERLGPVLMRHPAYLAADTVLAIVILAVAGPTSPFFYFTLGTAVLAGLLYSWNGAAIFSALLLAGYGAVIGLRASFTSVPHTFQNLVGMPALYPLAAVAGAAIRRLFDQEVAIAAQLNQAARSTAAAEERARLAREMHDSVAKTLHGIALSATALAGWIERRPDEAVVRAKTLARSAELAAQEARQLIANLRADRLERPLAEILERTVAAWSDESGVDVKLNFGFVDAASPAARYELLCILLEALRNVERHARASLVCVRLREKGGMVEMTVADDGIGFRVNANHDPLEQAGHYGLIGMEERARHVGGRLVIRSRPGLGTVVRASAPPHLAEDLATISRNAGAARSLEVG